MEILEVDNVTSDMHFGHENIIDWRERDGDVDEMGEDLVAAWNSVVAPDETTLVLGDAVMGPRLKSLPWMDRLNGTKILLPGNHDHCWRGNRRRITAQNNWPEIYGQYFERIIDDGMYEIPGLPEVVYLSHFPYYGDHTEKERYTEYRPDDNGQWLIHGHVHSLWRRNGRMINVGVDAWGAPLTIAELAALMDKGPMTESSPPVNPFSNRKEDND